MLLMAGVLAVTDQKNVGAPAWFTGPLVGLLVVAHRRGVRLQCRLRDQSGARLRSAALHLGGRLGLRRVHRRRRLVVGADRRPDRRRHSRRVVVRRLHQQASRCARGRPMTLRLRALRLDERPSLRAGIRSRSRSGHDVEPRDRVRSIGQGRVDRAAGVPADLSRARPRRARSGSDLVHAAGDGEGGHRARRHQRARPRRDRRHQPARDDGAVGEGDRQADRQRDRVAEPRHRADLRSPEGRRARGDVSQEDRSRRRRLFLGHEDQAPARFLRRPARSRRARRGPVRHHRLVPDLAAHRRQGATSPTSATPAGR